MAVPMRPSQRCLVLSSLALAMMTLAASGLSTEPADASVSPRLQQYLSPCVRFVQTFVPNDSGRTRVWGAVSRGLMGPAGAAGANSVAVVLVGLDGEGHVMFRRTTRYPRIAPLQRRSFRFEVTQAKALRLRIVDRCT